MNLPRHWSDWALLLGGAGLALSFAMPALAQTPTAPDTAGITPAPVIAPATPAPTPTPAPVAPTPVAPPSVTRAPELSSTLSPARPQLVTVRTDADVRADMERARNLLVNADASLRTAKSRAIEARTNSEIKKRDIGAIDARLKAAKQLKADADKADLDRTRKVEQQRQAVYDRLEESWNAEAALASAQTDYGNQVLKVAEAELDLIAKASLGASGDAAALAAEQRLLQMRRMLADKARSMADREGDVSDKKLRVYQAWITLQTGK